MPNPSAAVAPRKGRAIVPGGGRLFAHVGNASQILESALHIYCVPDETLRMLSRMTKDEAVRFCVANDVPDHIIAREIGISIDHVREISARVK